MVEPQVRHDRDDDAFTTQDCLRLFGHQADDERWQGIADSTECLALVLWLVARDESGPHGG